ncbi:phiSA1p31-related protein [Streptomyces sp. NPDC127159]|uniref:phiSA1p31-related protein n=1 Tax=Streptomyces sp. NPDC127159 TaxID=3345378 RepID=UPI00363423B5
MYDLAQPHIDRHGQTWHYTGQRQSDSAPRRARPGPRPPPGPRVAPGPPSAVVCGMTSVMPQ